MLNMQSIFLRRISFFAAVFAIVLLGLGFPKGEAVGKERYIQGCFSKYPIFARIDQNRFQVNHPVSRTTRLDFGRDKFGYYATSDPPLAFLFPKGQNAGLNDAIIKNIRYNDPQDDSIFLHQYNAEEIQLRRVKCA